MATENRQRNDEATSCQRQIVLSSLNDTNLENSEKVLLNRADLKALGIPQSNSSLIRAECTGRFPKRIRLSAACVAWDRDEIMEWISARKAERANWQYADAT